MLDAISSNMVEVLLSMHLLMHISLETLVSIISSG